MLTLKELMNIVFERPQEKTYLAAAIGILCSALAERSTTSEANFGKTLGRLLQAVGLGQLEVYFDRYGRYCGHMWWTFLPPQLTQAILRENPEDWSLSELSGGQEAVVISFDARHGKTMDIVREWKGHIPSGVRSLAYMRQRKDRKFVKRASLPAPRPNKLPRPQEDVSSEPYLTSAAGVEFRHSVLRNLEHAIRMGMALTLCGQVPAYAAMSVAAIVKHLWYPLRNEQYHIHLSERGEVVGFYSWAWMQAESLLGESRPLHLLAPYEWNEGPDLVLCDAIARDEGIPLVLDDLKGRWNSSERLFVYARALGSPGSSGAGQCFPSQGGKRRLPEIPLDLSGAQDLAEALIGHQSCGG